MAYTDKLDQTRPSIKRADLLSGRVAWEDADAAIRSWVQLDIYNAANTILKMDGKKKRREALARIPPEIRPIVEAEVLRIWQSN